MNQHGLAVSLAFGGRKVVGDGFGIPLILRYILEFCDTTAQATEVLGRIPTHMAYNVTLLEKSGTHVTVFVSPDRDPIVTHRTFATNHQDIVDWPEHAVATASLDRAKVLSHRLRDVNETGPRFASRFLEPPLYQGRRHLNWSTLYTAIYEPTSGRSTFRWPGIGLDVDFSQFIEQVVSLPSFASDE
jgi:predicted choloylglycine hydrolase